MGNCQSQLPQPRVRDDAGEAIALVADDVGPPVSRDEIPT
jgi:hypothetical protein